MIPSEVRRYSDGATENTVLRLTDPAYSSHLPPVTARPFLQRGGSLLYVSDRGGVWQAYRMDVRSGQSRQITKADSLRPDSIAVSPDERSAFYVDGESLRQVTFVTQRERIVDRREAGWNFGGSITVSDDGASVVLVETHEGYSRLRLLSTRSGAAANLFQTSGTLSQAAFRPRTATLACRRDDGTLWLLARNGQKPEQVGMREGRCGASLWSADGRSLLYLHFPEQGVSTLREYLPDSKEDRLVSRTSQFVQFARNSDASVFVGLSGSKASPYVLLLVRKVRRELALCEHRAAEPGNDHVLFAPNSQRVYFESDRFGKPVLLAIVVDRLVENTEQEP